MALHVAAAALQGGRWLEDVPEGLGAGLAVGGEVVERGDKFVALVGQTVGLVALGGCLHLHLLSTFTLVGIQDLSGGGTRQIQICGFSHRRSPCFSHDIKAGMSRRCSIAKSAYNQQAVLAASCSRKKI